MTVTVRFRAGFDFYVAAVALREFRLYCANSEICAKQLSLLTVGYKISSLAALA